MNHGRKYLVLLLAVLSLASCTQNSVQQKEPEDLQYRLLNQGYSLEYAQGYEVGCSKINAPDAPLERNETMFAKSKDYRRGYNQGMATCKSRYGEISREFWQARKKELSDEQKWNEINK